jgi:ATP-dependent exoDNAse (exonuclease V) alpha subunit
MVWAEFIHRTTRPVDGMPDPQLHCHAVAFNATYDPVEERWKAGEFGELVRDKGYYQAAFHSRLAEKLTELGYGIERDGNSFKLAGIDESTCEEFSRRTAIIEAEAQRLGITDPNAKRELGRRTREGKPAEQKSMSELRQEWRARISDSEQSAITEARRGQETNTLDAGQAVDYALSHCFERASAVTQKKLLQTALIQSYGTASVDDVRGAAQRDSILHNDVNGQRYVTTRDVLREEQAMIDFARFGRATRDKLGGYGSIDLDPHLSDEQRQAALTILNSRDRVTGLNGGAGTGKTRMMQATVAAIEKTGRQVFTFAPSAEASHGVLKSEGFANAETVERLLIDPEMQKKVKGQVLWVDEAGLLSVKDMKRLFDVAETQDARVILSGDSAQHNAVLRGDALRVLENNSAMQFAALKQISRQTNEAYRKAVASISKADAIGKDGKTGLQAGMETLDNMGAVIEAQGDARYKQIAADYLDVTSQEKRGGEFKTALVVSPTNAEARHVTDAIRDTLKESGKLSAKEREFTALRSRNLTEAERGDASNYHAGEVIQFHQNAKGFKRGERVTVLGVESERNTAGRLGSSAGVMVERTDGSKSLLPFAELKKYQLYRKEQLALAEGDKLRITMNGFTQETRRGLLGARGKDRLNNGAVYEVEGFTRAGDIKLTNGFVVPKNYGGLTHGYVVTSHASQGKTVDVSLVALGSESFAAANREQLYVSLSRGREAVRLYTDDKAAMMDAVQSSSARLSATELMQSQKPARKPGMKERFFKHAHRVYQKLRERIAAHEFVHAYTAHNQGKGLGHER